MNVDQPAQRPPRILVVKLSSLGDLFHALPAVHNLKIVLGAAIDWAVQSEYADLVRCFADVDRVIAVPRRRFLRGALPFLRDLRVLRYDRIVDLQGLLKSAAVSLLARGGPRIGPSFHREGTWVFYSAVAGTRSKQRHAVEENLDVVRQLGLKPLPPEFPIRLPSRELDTPRPRIALFPVSRWPAKNWPVARFAEVARRLHAQRGAAIYVFGSPAECGLCEQIARSVGEGVHNLAGKTDLVDMGCYLKQMDLVICNDSGPMHYAAALNVPTLAVFGPTDPVRTGPYGPGHRVLTADIDCRPCFERECRRPEQPCLSGIPAERVIAAALEMLDCFDKDLPSRP